MESKLISIGGRPNIDLLVDGDSASDKENEVASIDYIEKSILGQIFLQADISDVSTSGTVYLPSPVAGNVTKIWSCLGAAITSGDAVLTFAISGVAITSGQITIAQSGSAAGDVDSCVPTGAMTLTAGTTLSAHTNGGSTNTAPVKIIYEITPSM